MGIIKPVFDAFNGQQVLMSKSGSFSLSKEQSFSERPKVMDGS